MPDRNNLNFSNPRAAWRLEFGQSTAPHAFLIVTQRRFAVLIRPGFLEKGCLLLPLQDSCLYSILSKEFLLPSCGDDRETETESDESPRPQISSGT